MGQVPVYVGRAGAVCADGDGSSGAGDTSGDAGSLVLKKTAGNGITVAVAKRKPKIVTWRTELEQ